MARKLYLNLLKKTTNYRKIINILSKSGRKEVAERIFFKILFVLNKQLKNSALKSIKQVIVKNSMFLRVYNLKIGKRPVREIPFLVKPSLRFLYSLKNILSKISVKVVHSFCNELYVSDKSDTNFLLRRSASENFYKEVFTKKSFSHFRWF